MKKYGKYIFSFFIVYILIMAFYYAASVDLGNTPLYLQARRFLPATLAFCLPFFIMQELRIVDVWHNLSLSILYIVIGPSLAYLTFHKTATILSCHFDIAFGLYLFPSLIYIYILLNKMMPVKIAVFLMSFFDTFLLIPIFFQISYFLIFDHCITSNGTLAVYQTNSAEAVEYIKSLGVPNLAIFTAIFLLVIYFIVKFNNKLYYRLENIKYGKRKRIVMFILFFPIIIYAFSGAYMRTYFNELALYTHQYFKHVEEFKNGRKDILKNLQVKQNADNAGTIVLVIGESATRNYMSAFSIMEDQTTPWLSSNKNNNQFLLFTNTYSCAWSTVPALEHALTDSNFYNDISFNKSVSIIDVAKKAGYKTYWLSNQGTIGPADTPITLIAQSADVSAWICEDMKINTIQYDEVLLEYLKHINPKEKNFIVLHIMGSHIDYNNRYPKNFQKWTDPGETGRLADYKNSVLYTDSVLKRFFIKAKKDLPLQAFVYCSDHGTDPNRRRNPDESGFVVLRIPMFIYFSEDYIEKNSEVFSNLKKNINAYWSNDLLYDTLCGILNISSNRFDYDNSLTSSSYKYTKNDVKAGLGKKWVKDDGYL